MSMQALRATPCAAPRCGPVAARVSRRALSARAAPAGRSTRLAVRAVAAERAGAGAAAGLDGLLDVVVVGGGISGLCTAQALVTKHAGAARRVVVTESRDRVGGNITTASVRPRAAPRASRRGCPAHGRHNARPSPSDSWAIAASCG
jgi:hypothetical protein